jgi:hypothetical protein
MLKTIETLLTEFLTCVAWLSFYIVLRLNTR